MNDSEMCWGDMTSAYAKVRMPCYFQATTPIGLCERHYGQIVVGDIPLDPEFDERNAACMAPDFCTDAMLCASCAIARGINYAQAVGFA